MIEKTTNADIMSGATILSDELLASYEPVIGLEVHAQLKTATKAYCSCSTRFDASPNTNICPVCSGQPGALPVLNKKVVEFAVLMGLATGCSIREYSGFARKNYFYPDLPKGYQISQFDDPICYEGSVEIEIDSDTSKHIGITRIHMEEDAGKSIHDLDIDTLVDLNRSGVPLIEIVSEPDIRSASEAYQYLMTIRQTLMYLGICDGNMEEGSLRCDANVSVRKKGGLTFGTKVEVKNMNSFRNVEKAIEYEIRRQIRALEQGEIIEQETRGWDAATQSTRAMRSKERAHDYRYFPEPDLLNVQVTDRWKEQLRNELPELPLARKRRYMQQYELPSYDAGIFVEEQTLASYYERTCAALGVQSAERYKLVSNWIMTEVMRLLSEEKILASEFALAPEFIAELVDLYADGTINSKVAKEIFPLMLEQRKTARVLVEELGLVQVSDTQWIATIIDEVLATNPDTIDKYKNGKTNVVGFLVGQAMKNTQGKANPTVVTELLMGKLTAAISTE